LARAVVSTLLGRLERAEAIAWMARQPAGCARLIVADPPYNLGKAAWDDLGSGAEYVAWSRRWIDAARRLLRDDGTLYVCGFPEPLARVAAEVAAQFHSFRLLAWYYRNKASTADDWGRAHESILHLRAGSTMVFNTDAVRVPYNAHTTKYPERPQAATSQFARGRRAAPPRADWAPHPLGARPRDVLEIPTLCNGSREKTAHPTQKPLELIRALVLASSNPGDLVIDPFGGSGTTFVACEASGRRWLGCEREAAYCRIAARRLADMSGHEAGTARETAARRAGRRAALRSGS
jgi:site-specific DNA-methyltransferase (adenine-specific)